MSKQPLQPRGILFKPDGTHEFVEGHNIYASKTEINTIWYRPDMPTAWKWCTAQKSLDSSGHVWTIHSNPSEEIKLKAMLLGDNW